MDHPGNGQASDWATFLHKNGFSLQPKAISADITPGYLAFNECRNSSFGGFDPPG
jgi:hypothetical protein